MATVWKQIIEPGWQEILGRPVYFDAQGGELCVWFEPMVNTPGVLPTMVCVFGTGHPIPDGAQHLFSCQQGPFVWHLYTIDKAAL